MHPARDIFQMIEFNLFSNPNCRRQPTSHAASRSPVRSLFLVLAFSPGWLIFSNSPEHGLRYSGNFIVRDQADPRGVREIAISDGDFFGERARDGVRVYIPLVEFVL